jgi:hypothetical protein
MQAATNASIVSRVSGGAPAAVSMSAISVVTEHGGHFVGGAFADGGMAGGAGRGGVDAVA